MRYPKDHKEQTRRRVVDVASQAFRRDGIVASGVVGLMAQAGLTQGGFYSHFTSKDALVEEAIGTAQKDTQRKMAKIAARTRAVGEEPIDAMIDGYLSMAHVDAPQSGCTLAAIGPEMGRQSDAVRRTAFANLGDTIEIFADALPSGYRDRALPLFTMMAGTVQYARLAGTQAEKNAILESGRAAARALVGHVEEVEAAPALRAV